MDFFTLVKMRRSVRSFSDRDVDDETIKKIIECGRLAPSWANKQCWTFIVVKDKNKIAEIAREATMVNNWLKKAPVIIVACGDPSKSGYCNDIPYYVVDVSIAMEHIVLAAAELGLGTCWIGYFREKEIKKLLNIPEHLKIVALSPLGYPAGSKTTQENITRYLLKSKKRKPLEQILFRDEWGKTF